MKPLTHCPHCKSSLVKKTIPEDLNPMKYEHCSKRCVVDYFQYHPTSYQDEEIQYISFNMPNNKLHAYYYTCHSSYPPNSLLVYSSTQLARDGIAGPCLTLSDFIVDFDSLEKLQEKLAIYVIFS